MTVFMKIYLIIFAAMKNANYIENIEALDFQIENKELSSIYFVSKLDEYIESNFISPYIIIALDKAKLFNVDAVYFRFFEDNRPPLAQIYIYDNIGNFKNRNEYIELHKAIWSSCDVPLFMIIENSTIKIFDGRSPIQIIDDQLISKSIIDIPLSNVNDAIKDYKAQLFDNGSFWESEVSKKNFLNNKIASERLIRGLKEVRLKLHEKSKLSNDLVDRILIICILIKYLEENGFDKSTNKNLAFAFFKNATGYEKLDEIIQNNKLIDLLNQLAVHFNGGIFQLKNEWQTELKNSDISQLASFFEAGFKNNLFGWKEYSFEHIPIELISNFYEEFIPKSETRDDNGAVYTPSFIVNALIDECLPLSYRVEDLNENVKLIDVSCGSGIFLVSAFKRLVQRWRLKERKNGKLANTNPLILKKILRQNIYGVDKDSNAVNLSIFSLQLCLCSMLSPKQIWTELNEFDNLAENQNIINKDFFDYLIDDKTKYDFMLVIGNPPFVEKKLDGKSFPYYKKLLDDKFPIKFNYSTEQFALLFLEKAMHLLLIDKGKLCLILPSGPLLYSEDSQLFKNSLFKEYNVTQIIDFTYLRRILFTATVPTLALFVEKRVPTSNPILHIIIRRLKPIKEKSFIELSHYDFYPVPKLNASNGINIWKCNLLGGARVFNLIEKLNSLNPKIKDIENVLGIIPKSIVRKEDVSTFINLEPTLFDEYEMPKHQENNSLAIRKKITHGIFPTKVLTSDFKSNKKKFDGITFKGDENAIKLLNSYFNNYSKVICFYIAAISGRQGIRSPYVFTYNDLMKFPYFPSLETELNFSDNLIINDIADYILDEFGNGEKAKINLHNASTNDLKLFSNAFVYSLNIVYSSNGVEYRLSKIFKGNSFYICQFEYTSKSDDLIIEEVHEKISDLLSQWNCSNSMKINKVIRIYQDDKIYLIKPKQLRYWLQSIALRDADETFIDIISRAL